MNCAISAMNMRQNGRLLRTDYGQIKIYEESDALPPDRCVSDIYDHSSLEEG